MSRQGARAAILLILIALPIGALTGCGGSRQSEPITEKFKPDPELNPKPAARTAAPAQVRD